MGDSEWVGDGFICMQYIYIYIYLLYLVPGFLVLCVLKGCVYVYVYSDLLTS